MRGISRLTITVQVLPRDGAGGEWRGAVGALPFEAPRRRRVRGEYAERRTRILARIGCWAGCPGRSGPATADRVGGPGPVVARPELTGPGMTGPGLPSGPWWRGPATRATPDLEVSGPGPGARRGEDRLGNATAAAAAMAGAR